MKREPRLSGQRVMVVEDEYFIASDTAGALRSAGAEVIGPFPDEEAAQARIAAGPPDAAIVDINLGKGPSFKLAEALRRHGVPFVFVTGYDQENIPREFSNILRLQKPVQLEQVVEAVASLVA